MTLIRLAWQSLWNRRFTSALTIFSIALSVVLLLGLRRLQEGARESFSGTISQADLLVGARGAPLNLLLYSVFHMGEASNNISVETWNKYVQNSAIEWTIPISLGDSHQGYRVVGTNDDFFKHYRYRGDRALALKEGAPFRETYDVVLGAEVAKKLGYRVGHSIVVSHGLGGGFLKHDQDPFKVVGVLQSTGTPVDRGVYVTLEGIEAMHMDWQNGAPSFASAKGSIDKSQLKRADIRVKAITSFIARAKTRIQVLHLKRAIDTDTDEPLMAVMPGVALSHLWQTMAYAEQSLTLISLLVVLVGFVGMLISIYTSLNERRREMAILRSVGARPFQIVFLLVAESLTLTAAGVAAGFVLTFAGIAALRPLVEQHFGLALPLVLFQPFELAYLGGFLGLGLVVSLVPAIRAYRNALADGLIIRV